jgi:hypothetical protein
MARTKKTKGSRPIHPLRTRGYPVALKVQSSAILHKSDIGGVLLGLADAAAVRRAATEGRMAAAGHRHDLDGFVVQPMSRPGLETFVGATRDAAFAPVVTFGTGGVDLELGTDVLRLAPPTSTDAVAMIEAIRGRRRLDGVRGAPPADRAALVDALLRISRLVQQVPGIAEFDINPLVALSPGRGVVAVDARVRVVNCLHVLMLASFALVSCGGPAPSGGASADASSDATTDAKLDASAWSPCPVSPPAAAGVCGSEGLQCEYGTEWHVDCDVLMVCRSGRWQTQFDGGACDWRYGDAGTSCSVTAHPPQGACAAGAQCEYAEGHCDCAASCGGNAGPADASASWICTPPPQPGCSAMRPRLGEGCGAGAQDADCDYRLCCAGVSMTCIDAGYWQGVITLGGCP